MVHASNIARFVGLDLSPAELRHAIDFVSKPDAAPLALNEMQREDKPQTAPHGEPDMLFVSLTTPRRHCGQWGDLLVR